MSAPIDLPLRCICGQVRGVIGAGSPRLRGICYCRDCRAYAHHLGRAEVLLDAAGGSDITATLPRGVHFHTGVDRLRCLRLAERGPLRWYTACCHTPVGNTAPDWRLPFVGIVHACLADGREALDTVLGAPEVRVFAGSALAALPERPVGVRVAARWHQLRFMAMVMGERLRGNHQHTPYFREDGQPLVAPHRLTEEAWRVAYDKAATQGGNAGE
ncbi:MAG: DUF6151 family protein [Pseudomonadales bacterium]